MSLTILNDLEMTCLVAYLHHHQDKPEDEFSVRG
jgi:hypothetical protein